MNFPNNNNNNNNKNVWRDVYFLRTSMLPSFLSISLAQKILVIGKTINFLKICIQVLLFYFYY